VYAFFYGSLHFLTYFIFAAAAMRFAVRTRDVVVPQVTGKSVSEAGGMLGFQPETPFTPDATAFMPPRPLSGTPFARFNT
jgi:hypothetical protein